jgi:hypothetical protein
MNKNELKVSDNSKLLRTGEFLRIAPLRQAVPNKTLLDLAVMVTVKIEISFCSSTFFLN